MAAIGRKDKQSLLELDNHVKEVRQQFSDQIKSLDSRLDNKLALVADIQEFIRKRSELEIEYSKNMERLVDRFKDRFQKQRSTYGLSAKERAAPVNLWWKLLKDTRFRAKAASTFSDIISKNVATRLSDMNEDVSRISRHVRETLLSLQEEIMGSVHEVQQSMKIYYTKQSELIFAHGKLKESFNAKLKAEKDAQNKKGNERRMKNIDRLKEKRQARFNDCRIKATKARNDYILLLKATSAILNKYYDHDIDGIIAKTDHNYHNSFKCAFQAYCRTELHFASSVTSAADSMSRVIGLIDPDNDRHMFLEDNQQSFLPDKKLCHLKHSEDSVTTITAIGEIKRDLDKQHEITHNELQKQKSNLAELGDLLLEKNSKLTEIYHKYDTEMNAQHSVDIMHPVMSLMNPPTTQSINPQIKVNKEECEVAYLQKFRELVELQRWSMATQVKHETLTDALRDIAENAKRPSSVDDEFGSALIKPIKLFGTTLEFQAQATGQDIPELVESCIRFMCEFGLDHHGIFRVSGTSQEISEIKKSFEEGKNPLASLNHRKDINAVAGVFRAYFRELEEPLFPSKFCDDYIRISRIQSNEEQIQETQKVMDALPSVNLRIIKYLFKFLNLISTKSDVNKMTPHNLAVVFGPTVIRAPATVDVITSQGQINIFIETFIREFFNIFFNEKPLNDDGTSARSDGEDENDDEDGDEDLGSDEEIDGDFLEAEALFDYCARSHKELSFKKGDIIKVFSRANKDWWDAKVDGSFGFVPANYVKVASSDAERLDILGDDSSSSGATEIQTKGNGSSEEPLLLEEKSLSPRSDDDKSPFETSWPESQSNVFVSIDPTASKSGVKSSTIGNRSVAPLAGPQPFLTRGASLPRQALKSESDLISADSLSTTVTAVREAFGGPRPLKPGASKSMTISATDLKNTQSKLRPGTPDDTLTTSETSALPEERGLERGGSVKNISQMFNRQGSGPLYRKQAAAGSPDDALSPSGDEIKRLGSIGSSDEPEKGKPPAPAVKPKPFIKRESAGLPATQPSGIAAPSELIASIKAAAAAKVVKDSVGGVKEETNL